MTAVQTSTQALVKEALRVWIERWEENSDNEDPNQMINDKGRPEVRNSGTAMEMLFNYIEERKAFMSECRLVSVEQPFAVPLDENEPDLYYVGRLDKVVKYQNRHIIIEHKTTTSYKKDGPFRDDFTMSFSPNSQIDGYLYAGHMLYGKSLKSVWVDGALVHASVHDGFRFIPVDRQLSHLSSWLWETRYWIAQIEANERALEGRNSQEELDYMPAFPKNTSACTNYGGCPYLDLCKMVSDPSVREDFPGYLTKKWEPFDELEFQRAKGLKIKKRLSTIRQY